MNSNKNLSGNTEKSSLQCSEIKEIEISPKYEIKSCKYALDSLTEEILIQIFKFLPRNDIISSTLVCKYFNNIISNNSHLLSQINFTIGNHNKDSIISRKYRNVNIFFPHINDIVNLKFNEKSVKYLNIFFGEINSKLLGDFLKKFVNLENFVINFTSCRDLELEGISPLPVQHLKKLHIETINPITNESPFTTLFTNWQLRELKMQTPMSFMKQKSFIQLMQNQQNLTALSANFIDFTELIDVKFKLKSLAIKHLNDNQGNKLRKFLRNQQEISSLEIHEISDKIAEILNCFTKLTSLTVDQGKISDKFNTLSIETLRLITNDYENSFPNVKELYLYHSRLTTMGDMKYLHKLTLDNTNFGEISIPTVKILTLSNACYNNRPFNFETSNLEELDIYYSRNLENWIFDYLNRNETQLNKLRIKFCNILPETLEEIMKYKMKVKIFEFDKNIKKIEGVNEEI